MSMQIDYGYEITNSYTDTHVGKLNPSPTIPAGTYVYLAPNGNDGNSGLVIGSPVLTLQQAIIVLNANPARAGIIIIRNGYSGEMVFELTANLVFPANKYLGCGATTTYPSEYAVIACYTYAIKFNTGTLTKNIEFRTNGPYYPYTGGGAGTVPGDPAPTFENCAFAQESYAAHSFTPCIDTFMQTNFTNCHFYYNGGLTGGYGVSCRKALTYPIEYTVMLTNCVMQNFVNCVAILLDVPNRQITLNNTYLCNSQALIRVVGSGAGVVTITANNCLFANANYAFDVESAVTATFTTASSCFYNTNKYNAYNITNHTFTHTNELVTSALLFVDESDFSNTYNPESAKLQLDGMPVPGSPENRYYITSPLYSYSISPFTQTATLAGAFNKIIEIDWPSQSLQIQNRYINRINNEDVNGNSHVYFRNMRRVFTFTYGDGIHISNRLMKKLNDLFSDTGSKKFFPLGHNANLLEYGVTSTGLFSTTDNSFAPNLPYSMIRKHWTGFWITIVDHRGNIGDYYIYDNDEFKIYITNKLGMTYPGNGAASAIISYILVNTPIESYAMSQPNFTEFLKGGQISENIEEVQPYDLSIESIVLNEIEDLEE